MQQTDGNTELTYKAIIAFWIPLFSTMLMMMVEAPLLASIIARLPNPKFNLAAYGVAYSLAMFFEAPIMAMMSASNSLVKDRGTFFRLRNYAYALNAGITILMLLMLVPPVFSFIVGRVIGLPKEIATLSYISLFILLLWPPAIGYRRFYQGILIRYNKPERVAYGTVVRLSSMGGTALICYLYFPIEGAYVGATALLAGVLAEAVASRVMVHGVLRKVVTETETDQKRDLPSYRGITKFYAPLALTYLLSIGLHPLLTFFMGKGQMPIESLAVYPVAIGFLFIFHTFGWSFQDVCIALFGRRFENYKKLRNMTLAMGILSTGSLFLISITPLAAIWYHRISGLSMELTRYAILPTRIFAVIPFLHCLIFFQRSAFIVERKTEYIIKSSALEISVMMVFLSVGIFYLQMVGIVAAAVAMLVGRIVSFLYLLRPLRTILEEKGLKDRQPFKEAAGKMR